MFNCVERQYLMVTEYQNVTHTSLITVKCKKMNGLEVDCIFYYSQKYVKQRFTFNHTTKVIAETFSRG